MSSMKTYKRRKFRISTEWVTFIIASLLIAILIGLVLLSWSKDKQPPVLSVSESEVRAAAGQFYVPFTVENTGGETVESVQVIGELRLGADVETGEQQIDFLSGGEAEEGAFIFSRDPRQGDLRLRVASYRLP